jgi:hypothetical protein
VRDLAVRERLQALAREAAERLRELIDSGEEVPFELMGPGEGSPFCQYAPQSGRFIREHWAALAELDSFAEACAAISSAKLATAYLDGLDEPVPPDEDRRAEAAAIVFLSRVWEGASDFQLEGDRFRAAMVELEGCAEAADGEAEIVAPLIGFHMPSTRLALASATLVRADVVEVPDEMSRTDGARRSAWEPQFLAIVRAPLPRQRVTEPIPGEAPATTPGAALREVVTTLRLFKPGGVGLGPHAWARAPRDRWRRLATGAARPRPGGYRLTDSELGDLAALSRAVANNSAPLGGSSAGLPGAAGALARAVSRFEAGLERAAALEALSDYLLALRYLFEGGGGAQVGLAMRVAALCGEPASRPAIKAEVERAVALEHSLIRGEHPGGGADARPLELIAAIEERTRSLLRDVARGRLEVDLRAAADEALLADGLAAGEGASELHGSTAEWDAIEPGEPQPAEEPVTPDSDAEHQPVPDPVAPGREAEEATGFDLKEIESEQPTRVLVTAEIQNEHAQRESDWLSEVDSRGDTLDWPDRPDALRLLDQRPAERERARRRVRHLFPRPETTEWGVAELQYDRRRRRAQV